MPHAYLLTELTYDELSLATCLQSYRTYELQVTILPNLRTFFFGKYPERPGLGLTGKQVRTVHSAILRLAGVLQGHHLLRAPHTPTAALRKKNHGV